MARLPYIDAAYGMAFPAKLPHESWYMFVLDGYFDQSGHHTGSDTVVVAGYLAHSDAWRAFERKWNAALEEYELEFFHMTDFAAQQGPYAVWPESVRRVRLGHLISLINEHTVSSYGVSLPKKLFDSVFSEHARRFVGGPIGFAAMQCILWVAADLQEVPIETGVTYILEDGAPNKGEVLSAYEGLRRMPDAANTLHLLSLRFEPKKRFVPLQAADILAYELYKELPNQMGLQAPKHRAPFHLLRTETSTWKLMQPDDLKAYAALVDLLVRSRGSP